MHIIYAIMLKNKKTKNSISPSISDSNGRFYEEFTFKLFTIEMNTICNKKKFCANILIMFSCWSESNVKITWTTTKFQFWNNQKQKSSCWSHKCALEKCVGAKRELAFAEKTNGLQANNGVIIDSRIFIFLNLIYLLFE